MMGVVRMNEDREKAHLEKLREKLSKAILLRAKVLSGKTNRCTRTAAQSVYSDSLEAYQFYKKEYGL